MKPLFAAASLLSALLISGCASPERGLVLDPVGPPSFQPRAAGLNGSLMVFSATDPQAHFNGPPYRRYYTDYKLLSEDGSILQNVRNENGASFEGPRQVPLQEGKYRVVARANGYGIVTVPVIVVANQLTVVHLEGGRSWPDRAVLANSNPVRLPDGRIIGWRASGAETPQP